MNTYSLVLNGAWWLLVIFLLMGFALSIWAYRKTIPPISERKRYLLVALRGLALSLMIFALFEPIYSVTRAFLEKPKIAVLLDNSISAGTQDARFNRTDLYKDALERSNISSLENLTFLFDRTVRLANNFSIDSLDFTGQATDISRAIRNLNKYKEDENIKAVVMFTDGAFNIGANPLFDAEKLAVPFYIVGIGDTTEPIDISITSLVTNEVAYVENKIPINVNFKANGFSGLTIKLKLLANEQKVVEQEISIEANRQNYYFNFEYVPKNPGIIKLTAEIDPIDKEITTKNNKLSEFVRVLENKRNIALFAGAPSPDITMLKQSILLEKGVEIKEYIQKQGAEFYKAPTPRELQASEMIIFVGFPIQSTPKNVIDMIKTELERGKPLFFIASQATDYNKLKELQEFLPFVVVSSRQQELLVLPNFSANALSSPLLRISGGEDDLKQWNSLPPLFRTETFVRVKPESEILATMKLNNTPLAEPLIMQRQFQNSKSVALMGYGLHRWKLYGYAAEIARGRQAVDLLNIFVNNTIRWLSISEQVKPVRVRTSRKFYNENEIVEFYGEVYDAAINPIEKATIKLKIAGGNEKREITLSPVGSGNYFATIAGLRSGDYTFEAEGQLKDKTLGTDNGRFSIGELSIEYLNLKMNYPLLSKMAEITGGKFYFPEQIASIINDIKGNRNYRESSMRKRDDIVLWNLPYILGAIIMLLSAEWFIRKRSGML
jgi:hypothetical protein